MEPEEKEKASHPISIASIGKMGMKGGVGEFKAEDDATDHLIVDFDGPEDPLNPQNWSFARKWTIVILVSLMALMV